MARKKWKPIGSCTFDKDTDVLITDPCYLYHGDRDGHEMECEDLEAWISEHGGIMSNNFYGDWGCTVYRASRPVGGLRVSATKLGDFCADGGMVCVIGMDAVNERFPMFEDWLKGHYWCATIIRGFKGEVRFMTHTSEMKLDNGTTYKDVELRVRGDGMRFSRRFSFESIQTSL